ncbi:g1300 [Coccomyxa elongata]
MGSRPLVLIRSALETQDKQNGPQQMADSASQMQEDAKEQVQQMVENMEGALDEDTQAALDGFVGKYSFSDKELETFKELVDNMRGTAWGLLAATGITALLSATQQVLNGNFLPTDSKYMKGMTLARTFRVLDSLVLAALVYLGALCFKKVVATEENQLAYCVQGIVQLGILFMQMAPIAFCLAVVDLMVAAIRWPGVMLFAAVATAVFSVVRTGAVAFLLSRYRLGSPNTAKVLLLFREGWSALPAFQPLDRAAVMVVGATMMPYSPPKRHQTITPEEEDGMPVNLPEGLAEKARKEAAEFRGDGEKGESSVSEPGSDAESSIDSESREEGEPAEYEFTVWEDRILEVVMEAMRMAGLALAVRAIGTFCLGITEVRNLSVGGAWGYFSTDLVDQTVRSWLLFSSAGCFQKVIRRQGHDITNLLEGLGSSNGISLLFARMRKLTWGMTTYKCAELGVLLFSQTPVWAAISGWLRNVALPALVHFAQKHLVFLQPVLRASGVAA